MFEDPAVKATKFSAEDHTAFYKSYAEGKPDYDYGLQKNILKTVNRPVFWVLVIVGHGYF